MGPGREEGPILKFRGRLWMHLWTQILETTFSRAHFLNFVPLFVYVLLFPSRLFDDALSLQLSSLCRRRQRPSRQHAIHGRRPPSRRQLSRRASAHRVCTRKKILKKSLLKSKSCIQTRPLAGTNPSAATMRDRYFGSVTERERERAALPSPRPRPRGQLVRDKGRPKDRRTLGPNRSNVRRRNHNASRACGPSCRASTAN